MKYSDLQETLLNQTRPVSAENNTYVAIPTQSVIDVFEPHGFKVVDMQETGTRLPHRHGYQHHLVKLARDEKIAGDMDPNIVITNSYDGGSPLSVSFGAYRFACANGLLVGEEFEKSIVRHVHGLDTVAETFMPLYESSIKQITAQVEAQMSKKLNAVQQNQFASSVFEIIKRTPTKGSLKALLESQRIEDDENTVWNLFNRAQERVLAGDYFYETATGKVRTGKKIQSTDRLEHLNSSLYRLAKDLAA